MLVIILDSNNKEIPLEIKPSEKISDLIFKLRKKKGINSKIILHFNGKILKEDKEIQFYEIEEDWQIVYTRTFMAGLLKYK